MAEQDDKKKRAAQQTAAEKTAAQNGEQEEEEVKDERYNRRLDTQIAIWSVLATESSPDHPLGATEIYRSLKKLKEEKERVASASRTTVKRYVGGKMNAVASLDRTHVLREAGVESAKFAYFDAERTLHVVLEREPSDPVWSRDGDDEPTSDLKGGKKRNKREKIAAQGDRVLWDGEMQVIFEVRKPVDPDCRQTISNILKSYPEDNETIYGTGLTPLKLKCVMAKTRNGKTVYLPYQTFEEEEDEKNGKIRGAETRDKAAEQTMANKGKRNNRARRYYLESILSPAEWRIFADLVKVYPYITRNTTTKFLNALRQMNPGMESDVWSMDDRYAFKREDGETGNRDFFDIIHTLDAAIRERRTVGIQYGEYRLEKRKDGTWKPVLRQRRNTRLSTPEKDVYRWQLQPYALMWSNGYYYLVGHNDEYGMMNLRVDRILRAVPIPGDEAKFDPPPGFNPYEYRDKSPVMYPGEPKEVVLRCREDMVNTLLDFFGPQASFGEPEDGYTDVTMWIAPKGVKLFALQYADRVEVLKPSDLRDEVHKSLAEALEKYQTK